MFSKSLVGLALLATSVVADYSITGPVEGTEWKAGSKVTITWITDSNQPATPAKIDLDLMSGIPSQLQLKTTIASGVDSSAGKYEWTVPADVAGGTDYTVRAGNGGEVKYSHYFGVTQGQTTPSSASSVAASSSASPSGSASASASASGSASSGTASASASSAASKSSAASISSVASTNATSTASVSKATTALTTSVKTTASQNTVPISQPSTTTKPATNGSANLSATGFLVAIPALLMAYMRQ
ncbi:hypothetical protein K7432_010162 [Basidiobolus ranarum]|uniref:Yeast cell wall synthesis Kre9/Knh1-like N-terminal domain-containing protein n=1 Tax=Basidiobolus ranarum TaxID=34480 RepID=A0ABR2VVY7_9FUNG